MEGEMERNKTVFKQALPSTKENMTDFILGGFVLILGILWIIPSLDDIFSHFVPTQVFQLIIPLGILGYGIYKVVIASLALKNLNLLQAQGALHGYDHGRENHYP
jgi:hypothetical protein